MATSNDFSLTTNVRPLFHKIRRHFTTIVKIYSPLGRPVLLRLTRHTKGDKRKLFSNNDRVKGVSNTVLTVLFGNRRRTFRRSRVTLKTTFRYRFNATFTFHTRPVRVVSRNRRFQYTLLQRAGPPCRLASTGAWRVVAVY